MKNNKFFFSQHFCFLMMFHFFLIFLISTLRRSPSARHFSTRPPARAPPPDALPGFLPRTPVRWTAQNFALFFSSSRLKFHSLCSLWASFRGISVVFEFWGSPKCTFGLSGSSCETPAAPPKNRKKNFTSKRTKNVKNNEDQIKVKFKEGKQKTKEAKKKQHKLLFLSSFLFSPSSLTFFIVVSLKNYLCIFVFL